MICLLKMIKAFRRQKKKKHVSIKPYFINSYWFHAFNNYRNWKTYEKRTKKSINITLGITVQFRECSGSVVECLTRDRGAAGSSLTRVVVFEHDTFILA